MKLSLLFVLLVVQAGFAQHRTCGMKEQMQKIMNDPVKRAAYLDLQNRFQTELQRINSVGLRNVNSTIRIPVAVHFPSVSNGSTEAVKSCLRALAQNQVNILNADYNGTNTDIANWENDAPYYPNTNTGNMNVSFELATQNHPAASGLATGTVAVTFGTDFLSGADEDTTWSGYMNLVVRNEGSQILGYSPLGGSPTAGETVVINRFCFGSGTGCSGYVPTSPFNLGRTLTHELGHFFNLDHTFESCDTSGNCATSGDRVCDTPAVDTESYDCPAAGEVGACDPSEVSLTMNYMDYVDDPCMYMFTAGQAARMMAYYNAIASQFKSNVLASDEFLQAQFSLYPNPSKGSFTLQFKDLSNSVFVEIFDVTGKTIYENNFSQSANLTQVINLDKPSSGVYFVNIKSDKGLVTKKLIIE